MLDLAQLDFPVLLSEHRSISKHEIAQFTSFKRWQSPSNLDAVTTNVIYGNPTSKCELQPWNSVAGAKSKREDLKKLLRATIATYDLAIQDPRFAKKVIGKYTRTSDAETLDATYKENVKEYALRIPYVSAVGLRSIIDFRAQAAAEVKKLALEKMYDNSLLHEIQKETTK